MSTKIRLPQFQILKAPFLGSGRFTADFVTTVIGGKVRQNYEDPKQDYKNTCALRVSRALNYSGSGVRSNVAGVRKNSGSDKLWYIYGVSDMERYLRHVYGRPDIDKTGKKKGDIEAADFVNEQGIILFENYHVDLWNGSGCEGHCYFGSVRHVMLWRASPPPVPTS